MHSVAGPVIRTAGMMLVAVAAWCGSVPARGQELRDNEEFPNFTAPDLLTKKPIELEQFRGKVVLVDFWATWCGPCCHEIPNVRKAYEKYHDKGFEVISISLDGNLDTCKNYIKREKLDWHHICDGKRWKAELARKHRIRGIPAAIVVGKDGRIITTKARGEALATAIERGLAQKWGDEERIEKAETALARADRLQKKGQYAGALRLYDQVAKDCADLPLGAQASDRAAALRADPDVMRQIEADEQADRARGEVENTANWLKLAREAAERGSYELAADFYGLIIEKYPNSEGAKEARAELAKLPK